MLWYHQQASARAQAADPVWSKCSGGTMAGEEVDLRLAPESCVVGCRRMRERMDHGLSIGTCDRRHSSPTLLHQLQRTKARQGNAECTVPLLIRFFRFLLDNGRVRVFEVEDVSDGARQEQQSRSLRCSRAPLVNITYRRTFVCDCRIWKGRAAGAYSTIKLLELTILRRSMR